MPSAGTNSPVLLFHDGALGDVLLSLPCIRSVGATGGPVHFAGRVDIGNLLREGGVVAEVHSTAAARFAFLYGGPAEDATRTFLSSFRHAVVFTVDPESTVVHTLKSVLPDTLVVRTVPSEGSGMPVAAYRASQVNGASALVEEPLLSVPPLHQELAGGMLSRAGHDGFQPILAVHPGSGGKAKNWPIEKFFSVLDLAREWSDAFCILFSGPAEEGAMQDRLEDFARQRTDVVHFAGADLTAIAALLRTADLYVGNDSGIGHLAAAVGCRALLLYGPTDPDRWRPAGTPVSVLRAAELADLTIDTVAGRMQELLASPDRGR